MANVFQKADKIAATGLALLQRQLVLAAIFTTRYGISDFKGAKGDTVNVKRPALLKARDAGFRNRNAIVVDDLITSKIAVPLNKYPYSAVSLTDEELTLDVENYSQEITAPQSRALAVDFEDGIAGYLRGATYVETVAFDQNGTGANAWTADPRKVAIRARKLLNKHDVPTSGRYWIVGADIAEAIASDEKILEIDTSGYPEAVREGIIGRLGGFTIVESNALNSTESYFVHDSALALAYVAPAAPKGATSAGVAVEQGLAVRQLWDYDSDKLADRSILSVFTGGAAVKDPKIKADGTIQVTGGEVVLEFYRAVKVTFTAKTGA